VTRTTKFLLLAVCVDLSKTVRKWLLGGGWLRSSRRIPSVYFYKSLDDFPFNMKALEAGHRVWKEPYRDEVDIKSLLVKHWNQMFSGQTSWQ